MLELCLSSHTCAYFHKVLDLCLFPQCIRSVFIFSKSVRIVPILKKEKRKEKSVEIVSIFTKYQKCFFFFSNHRVLELCLFPQSVGTMSISIECWNCVNFHSVGTVSFSTECWNCVYFHRVLGLCLFPQSVGTVSISTVCWNCVYFYRVLELCLYPQSVGTVFISTECWKCLFPQSAGTVSISTECWNCVYFHRVLELCLFVFFVFLKFQTN